MVHGLAQMGRPYSFGVDGLLAESVCHRDAVMPVAYEVAHAHLEQRALTAGERPAAAPGRCSA